MTIDADRWAPTAPCTVCGSESTGEFSDLCTEHRDWIECELCGEYDRDAVQSTIGRFWMCERCHSDRTCDCCGAESDDIRSGIEKRMCFTCYKPDDTEEEAR